MPWAYKIWINQVFYIKAQPTDILLKEQSELLDAFSKGTDCNWFMDGT